jgi:hypothetical protein
VAKGRFELLLLQRFAGCHESPGGEVWVKAEDALSAVALAAKEGFRLLGLEGFIVGPEGVFPAMSRIADFSADASAGLAIAQNLLRGEWSRPPTDVHPAASGLYMIDVCVADKR